MNDELTPAEALWHYMADNSPELVGARWRWTEWRRTRLEWPSDECHFCHAVRFSSRGEPDLSEGWAASGPASAPAGEQMPDWYWVCVDCFDGLRARFGWTVDAAVTL